MTILNSLFQVVRGHSPGTNSSSIEETFLPAAAILADAPLVPGDIVHVQSDGTVNRATGSDWGTAAGTSALALATAQAEQKQFWTVISGSSDSEPDGRRPGGSVQPFGLGTIPYKVVAIRGVYMLETQNYTTRAYAPANKVTVLAGIVDITITGTNVAYQPFGEVLSFNATT
jgi:hypothetical protein